MWDLLASTYMLMFRSSSFRSCEGLELLVFAFVVYAFALQVWKTFESRDLVIVNSAETGLSIPADH